MITEATVKKLKRRLGAKLLALPSVTGVGICDADDGQHGAALAVYLAKPDAYAKRSIKALTHGIPVRFFESGVFAKR